MKSTTWREKLQYQFDNLMAKGTITLVCMLFLATAAVIVITGVLTALLTNGGTLGESIWLSLMHVIDAGAITGAATDDVVFLVLMSVVTLCGIFVTSILIGIITTGFEEKLTSLKKGNSRVIERNHTVILGFDSNIFTMISELVEANENQKDGCIVVLSETDREEVEQAIAAEVPALKTTRVICRTGGIADMHMLGICSLETARSIIINEPDDFNTIKAVLAANNYLNAHCEAGQVPHMVATITEQSNYEAVQIIAEGNAEVILVQDAISRIIAQTCRQPGLSDVLIELFDYDGDELYFEHFPELAGRTFADVMHLFEKAVVFGYQRDGQIYLNPRMDTTLQADDHLLLLVEDDGQAKVAHYTNCDYSEFASFGATKPQAERLLICGINGMVPQIVSELDEYFCRGSVVVIANPVAAQQVLDVDLNALQLHNITLEFVICDTSNRAVLEELTRQDVRHVLLLSDHEQDAQSTDTLALLQSIHLRDIARKLGRRYNITSEMKDITNQKLAKVAEVNDLVVGSNIINLILTQISENRDLATVFQELLQSEGAEIYMRKAADYVKCGTSMNFHAVTAILAEHNQVAIGYKKQYDDHFEIITNPKKSEPIIFGANDCIISLADD